MAIVEVKVPQLSESITEATMLNWKKKVGEAVAVDEILIEIETDKVVLALKGKEKELLDRIRKDQAASAKLESSIKEMIRKEIALAKKKAEVTNGD